MSTHIMAAALARQMDCTWESLRNAIAPLDDRQWRTGEIEFLIPARQTYHILELADFFVSAGPEKFGWNPLGVPDVAKKPNDFPMKDVMLTYFDQVRDRWMLWLESQTDDDLLGPNKIFYWTGPTLLDHVVYCLRHAQHHVGVLNSELRRRGLPRGEWVMPPSGPQYE